MWKATDTTIQMAEGDYGIALPVTVSGAALGSSETIKFTFKRAMNGETVLTKEYSAPSQIGEIVDWGNGGGYSRSAPAAPNTVNLEFSEAESALFPVGVYFYSMDWYQDGNFLCNIIPAGILKVVDKA